ncbi:sigma-70 family RNA polymerase sigma factor [Bacteroides uniformis]|uniref:Sigma-70 family RNA polymerase sigma factor n=1 Tax=Bacteroides uniformis TaxID=820 RepID=A0A6I0JVH5_BACUN|nr:sigma-70 family RNA polymerase sigma factor [Bacteroides uniformis]KAB4118274.1 sigma-70 family RNA polymerase sigma factor [Bacteroides uniformis]KAB4124219.1 sigma-70 family RNA polymerase sigma factor [Bacteroides uniformis]
MELKEFKITVLPLRAKLLNYARKLTDEPEDAEDAVQEVLLKLWNKRLELEQYRSIEAFAMTLTHNICIDMWRCKRNDTLSLDIVQAASPTGTPERLLEIKDEIRLMHEIIDSLPNLQRTIMRMKDIEGYETDEIADLFSKYGEQKDVTRVELNGSILKSYRMTTYKSLVFKNVSPYRREIQQAIVHDKQDNAKKAQEVMESGVLRSAYYQLKEVERNGKKLNRYIIFKIGKDSMGTLIYIEGLLSEKGMMDMLYKSE